MINILSIKTELKQKHEKKCNCYFSFCIVHLRMQLCNTNRIIEINQHLPNLS